MLTHLQVRDLVIVDRAELEFGSGLTALTGETGAGKSLVVDALLLVSGSRAGGDVVRAGAERAEVSASFDSLTTSAKDWLDLQAIEHGEAELVVRRVIAADGRSRAYVNGQIVSLTQLRELSERLIEIHGQQEFQHLVKRGAQRDLLDQRIADRGLLAETADAFRRLAACRRELETVRAAAAQRESRIELVRFQLAELAAEVTTPAAIEDLFTEQKRIAGRGRLADGARTALECLYEADSGSAHELLGRAQAALRPVDTDPALTPVAALIEEAGIVCREAADALRRFLDDLDIDPNRQEEIERRASLLESLARKHRRGVLELPAEMGRLAEELRTLDQAAESLVALETAHARLSEEYRVCAGRLSAARTAAAQVLGGEITALMQSLGMAGGRFSVSVSAATAEEIGAAGADAIEFLVSANPGQSLRSLARVASGGELSRISLAVHVAAATQGSPLCQVFDEVDAGIGGGTAEIVGHQLRALGSTSQVLCITHLAQVAAQAHAQFRVVKKSDGESTLTTVLALAPEQRVDEIARMIAGIAITPQARDHARDMLNRSGGAPHRIPSG